MAFHPLHIGPLGSEHRRPRPGRTTYRNVLGVLIRPQLSAEATRAKGSNDDRCSMERSFGKLQK